MRAHTYVCVCVSCAVLVELAGEKVLIVDQEAHLVLNSHTLLHCTYSTVCTVQVHDTYEYRTHVYRHVRVLYGYE